MKYLYKKVLFFLIILVGSPNILLAATCEIEERPGNVLVDFGEIPGFIATPLRGYAQVDIFCTDDGLGLNVGTLVTMTISEGSSDNFDKRHLVSGDHILKYNLYVPPLYRSVIGDGMAGNDTVPLTNSCLNAAPCPFIINALIDGSQKVPPGNYSDPVVVTIDF